MGLRRHLVDTEAVWSMIERQMMGERRLSFPEETLELPNPGFPEHPRLHVSATALRDVTFAQVRDVWRARKERA